MTGGLYVPAVSPEDATLGAALRYAEAGWYGLPVDQRSKHAGSVVGRGWPAKSSRDPEQLAAWFAGSAHALALHVGRSAAVVFDVDDPDALPPLLAPILRDTRAPHQSTRADQPGRGHYLYAVPPGRSLGNSRGELRGAWGEVRGRNGIIVVAPSEHVKADTGGRYEWVRTGPVPVLPDVLAAALPDALDVNDAATDAEVAAFLAEHTASARPELLDARMRGFAAKLTEGGSRHEAAVPFTAGAMREAAAGYYPARDAADRLGAAFVAALTTSRNGDTSARVESAPTARAEWSGILSWAVAQAKAADVEQVRQDVTSRVPSAAGETALAALHEQVRRLHHLDDDGPLVFALAVATSAALPGEPLWGMHVDVPSGGKTVTQEFVRDVADDAVDELTVAGLLSWGRGGKRGDRPRKVGVLVRAGERAFVTVGDFSTILATSDRGGRDQLFASLRRVYDGHLDRGIDSPSGERLSWAGRLTLLAAVTPEIDPYSSHGDALGPRWLYIRGQASDTTHKRATARKARRRGEAAEERAHIRRLAAQLVRDARQRVDAVRLSDEALDQLEDAALVACWGRAAVPRQSYGRRDVDGAVVVEEPPRLVRQLVTLARCAAALGVAEKQAVALARRCALDTVPAVRRDTLAHLSMGEPLTVSELARRTGHHRDVVRRALEDLSLVGVTVCPAVEDFDDHEAPRTVPTPWELRGTDGKLSAGVLQDNARDDGTRLATKSRYSPPIPP